MKKGWEIKSLEQLEIERVIQLGRGVVISKRDISSTPGDYPVYSSAKLNDGVFGRYGKYAFNEELITWSVDGGGSLFYRPKHKFSITNVGGFCRILNKNVIDYKYLFFILSYLHSIIKFDWVKKAHPSVLRKEYKTIPIPSLSEQKRIVSILDRAFADISEAKENSEKNLRNSKELFENYLDSIFENKRSGWEEKVLGDDELIKIIDGDRGKNYPTKKEFSDNGFCLFMNTKNVRPNGFVFNERMFISEDKDKAMGKGKLKRNDVVMTTRGTIGNLGVYNNEIKYDNIRINSGMLIFRPNTKKLLPEYLFEVLKSGIIKRQIKERVTGAAQPQLPIKTLIDFIFPFPKSLGEQKSIVKKLNDFSLETKKLENIYQSKLADLEELKKSILQKAFNGEL